MPLLHPAGALPAVQHISNVNVSGTAFVGSNTTNNTTVIQGPSPYGLEAATNAAFDTAGKEDDPFCLPKTRVQLLQNITDWVEGDNTKHIYWLRGWAGTGKSTIARTVAASYSGSQQWRVATFFFSRGGGDAGHIRKFTGTIATQLASQWPAFERALQGAISESKEIVRKRQQDQWRALVLQPLSKILDDAAPQRVLLVVDAVDECGSSVDMEHVVRLLLDIQRVRSLSFRIFVTSRPEMSIGDSFAGHLGHVPFVLHHIENSIVDCDLLVFFRHHFTEVCRRRRLRGDWPGSTVIHELVKMSATLFIWAATACRFIQEGGSRAKQRLSTILEGSGSVGGPDQALDQIYLTVLQNAVGGAFTEAEKEEAYQDLRRSLGTIISLYSPLSMSALSILLGEEEETIEQSLLDLHSVLEVSDDNEQPIRLHHPSFRDFLQNKERCTIPSLQIEVDKTHIKIAQHCIEVMKCLKKDVCQVKNYGTLCADVEASFVATRFSGAMSYACRYWVDHAEQGQWEIADGGSVDQFVRSKFLFWIEVMVWFGQYYEAVRTILKLERLVLSSAPSLATFVQDAKLFMLTFAESIKVAPLQIYSAALYFSPQSSLIRTQFWHLRPSNLRVHTQLPRGWSACQHLLEGHSDVVNGMVFSPDGSRVASSSYDTTVRIWNVQTGECEQTLEGHSREVNSVVFSPDGSRVASSSRDTTVRIWNVQTGECEQTLEGHADEVNSVVFSPDGSRVASSSRDTTVRIWNVQTGECEQALEGHSRMVNSVVFSTDGSRVASSSWDTTVRIWNVQTGECEQTLEGHSREVNSVVFSPNGSRVASSSWDTTVRVWNIVQGTELLCHQAQTYSPVIIFSDDGMKIMVDSQLVAVPSLLRPSSTVSESSQPVSQSAIAQLKVDNDWITLSSQRILCLPFAYRPTTRASKGKHLVLGNTTGRIILIRYEGTD